MELLRFNHLQVSKTSPFVRTHKKIIDEFEEDAKMKLPFNNGASSSKTCKSFANRSLVYAFPFAKHFNIRSLRERECWRKNSNQKLE